MPATTPKSNNPFDATVVANGFSLTMQQIVAAQASNLAQTPRNGNNTNTTTQSNNGGTSGGDGGNTTNNTQATSPLNLNVGGSSASLDLTNLTGTLGGLTSLRSTSADSLRSNSAGVLTPTALNANTFGAAGVQNLPALQATTSVGSMYVIFYIIYPCTHYV